MPARPLAAAETWRARFADRDFRAGALLIAFGAVGLWLTSELDTGTLARPGGGFLPGLAAVAMLVSGLGSCAWSLWRAEAACADAPVAWRPVGFMLATAPAFVLALELAHFAVACAAAAACAGRATGAGAGRALGVGAVVGGGFYLLFGVAFAVR